LNADRELLARMGQEGWKLASKQFSNAAMAKKTFGLYDRLLDLRR
jgi:hypothetical protein